MSKTTQENKAKKAKKELAVEVTTENVETIAPETTSPVVEEKSTDTVKKIKHGKSYLAARKKYDINKLYSIKEAVELVKSTSLSKFDGKVEAHVLGTDLGNIGEITFPHYQASSKKIVILNDAVLAEIKDGKINFDILIATPATMPKLLPFAKTLGPKGLMPNPKNGTLTDKPEEAVKKLSVAKTMIKTEKKAPVIHIVVGKVSQPETELTANITELIRVIKTPKIKKFSLCATMGPSVKILVEK